MKKNLLFGAAFAAILTAGACSLMVDTTECASSADCERFNADGVVYSCVSAVCQPAEPECRTQSDCENGQDCQNFVCVEVADNNPTDAGNDTSVEPDVGNDTAVEPDVNMDMGDDAGTTIEEVVITESIRTDTTWSSDKTYVLDGIIYVEAQKRLVINAGTVIKGRPGAALVVKRGGRLESRGNVNRPVVFTSAQPEGQRLPGDWGGVALAGEAPINGVNQTIEGLTEPILFGGDLPDSSCGVIEYTRIEFAGYKLDQNKELNGLTLAGCGSGTAISYVQIHQGSDDGVEIFGGTVDLDHIVVTRSQDDGLDWDLGWAGVMQFLLIQQDATSDNGFESSNNPSDDNALPRSNPTIYNYTIVGSNQVRSQRAMTLKEGTAGKMFNGIITGIGLEAIDIRDVATTEQLTADNLLVRNTLFFGIGTAGTHFFPTPDEELDTNDDDGGFDEDAHFRLPIYANQFAVDPQLPDPFNLTNPDWVPPLNSPASMDAVKPPQGFDESAQFLGAFAPGQPAWTLGWTAYPEG